MRKKCLNLFWVQIFSDCIALWLRGGVVDWWVCGNIVDCTLQSNLTCKNHREVTENRDIQPKMIPSCEAKGLFILRLMEKN